MAVILEVSHTHPSVLVKQACITYVLALIHLLKNKGDVKGIPF